MPTGGGLEFYLQQAAIDFVGEARNVHIDHANSQIMLSDIFKWFEKDLINDVGHRGYSSDRGFVDYIASIVLGPPGIEFERSAEYKIVFHEYETVKKSVVRHEVAFVIVSSNQGGNG